MKNSDSIALLQECNSGSKMAVSSIRDVLNDIKEEKLKRLLKTIFINMRNMERSFMLCYQPTTRLWKNRKPLQRQWLKWLPALSCLRIILRHKLPT